MLLENVSAISTPIGVGGVAIIRISGDTPLSVAEKMFRPACSVSVRDFEPYRMYAGEIDCGDFTDFGMCVYFRAPKSYTGEEMVEFHCHGGVAITRGVLARTFELGCKPAGRGEFTKRAFLNGKLSLSSCEGLIDMINSESEGEVKAGYYLYKERLTREIRNLQDKLKESLSLIEAGIDFPEEGVEEADAADVYASVVSVKKRVDELASTFRTGMKIKNGVKVAIAGKPNTGKSSLLNALISCDKAIVSPVAGTTRDAVEATLVLGGVRFEMSDTAGIRASSDGVEAEGINRSRKILDGCDMAIVVLDGSAPLGEEDDEIIALSEGRERIIVNNKSDHPDFSSRPCDVEISAKTGKNLSVLTDLMLKKMFEGKIDLSGGIISEERHFYALKAASEALGAAAETINTMPLDAAAVDISAAWETLGEITGETASEKVIEDIFSRFCVGK
ncbi:MAG: tRNA uridine-5-carboxymethylaminomethyl(34) synthesis GTPase MnmE [Clostridia bacterium]|nr:tRNA uridine-5-carboxymethylaminomethyl(34) synthesis GTPase MnmE [Clostridia bacterium]